MKGLLLNTDGTTEIVILRSTQDYEKYIGGDVQLLPTVKKYISCGKQWAEIVCFVSEERIC